jgi:hypothetical protein
VSTLGVSQRRDSGVAASSDGLFVPKPSCGADCQGRSTRGLRLTVHACPLVSTVGGGDCHSVGHSALARSCQLDAFGALSPPEGEV